MTSWASAGLAFAEEPRFCPNRPSLGSSACTVEPGHAMVEQSFADWERDDSDGTKQSTLLFADTEARFGVSPSTEVQLSFTTLGLTRTRDTTGVVKHQTAIGDIRVGVRRNIRNPDGRGFSIAAEPFATLPVGRSPIGAGTWGAGLVVPIGFDLSKSLTLGFTATIEASPDQDGSGRHTAYDGIVGLGCNVSDAIAITGEIQFARDLDPAKHASMAVAAGSLAWQPHKGFQLDLLAVAGITHDAPDLRLVAGGAILF